MALVSVAGPKSNRPLGVQAILTLLHVLVLNIRFQALYSSPLRSLVALLGALGPFGGMPLGSALRHILQLALRRLLRFISLALAIIHDHLIPDAVHESRLGQVEAVPSTRRPWTSKPITSHALLLAVALPADVRGESQVTTICIWRRSIAENGPILHTRATLGAALVHPLGYEPRTCLGLLRSAVDSSVTRRMANDGEGTTGCGCGDWLRFHFFTLRLWTVTGLVHVWRISHTSCIVHLNESTIAQLLDATHVSCLDRELIFSSAVAFRPIGDLPVGRTRLRVALELTLVDHWLVQVHTLFGRGDFRGPLTDTFNDRSLNSSPTGLGARSELNHLP